MSSTNVAIIPCGNNLTSISNVLDRLEVNWIQVSDASDPKLGRASHLLLPGVGAFDSGMSRLLKSGLAELVIESAKKGLPILGICLGMQLFFDDGLEGGQVTKGLGLVPGRVELLTATSQNKVPNLGWRELKQVGSSRLLDVQLNQSLFYFLHSYGVEYLEQDFVTATTSHSLDLCAVIEKENLFGVQFHPEKSSFAGLGVLSSFLKVGG